MAIVDAIATGNYSNYAVTFGGITPQPGDTVRCNAFSVTLNIPITGITFECNNSAGRFLISQTEITANGGLLTLANCNFLANYSGNINILSASLSSGKLIISGTFSSVVGKVGAITLTGTAEVEIGTVVGSSTFGVSGILNISGNNLANNITVQFCKGGTALASHGIVLGGTFTGFVNTSEGGESNRSYGLLVNGATSAICYVEHSKPSQTTTQSPASPGTLIDNTNLNTLVYITNAYGSDGGEGSALNRTSGVWTSGDNGQGAMGNGTRVYIKNLIFGLRGQTPIQGTFFLWDTLDATAQFRLSPAGLTKTLGDPASFGNAPSVSNVRSGIVFNYGNSIGTCAVPLPGQTVVGVPVDNTVGTAVLTTSSIEILLNNKIPDIVDGVHEADSRDYDDIPGSIGFEFKKLRQANPFIEFTVTNDITPTANQFSVSITDAHATGSFTDSVIWFSSGNLTNDNNPILSLVKNQTYSIITLQKPMRIAPAVGDTGFIDPSSHIHSIPEIQNNLALEQSVQDVETAIGLVSDQIDALPTVEQIQTGLALQSTLQSLQTTVEAIPTSISQEDINAIKSGLALEATSESILTAIGEIDVDFTPILNRLPTELEDGRMASVLSSEQVSAIRNGLALDTTSQNILNGVISLNTNDRGEFF